MSSKEWEKAILDDIAIVIDSLHKTPTYSEIGYPMVRVTDIKGGPLLLDDTLKVSKGVYEEFSKKHKPRKWDIVFSRVGTYGVSSYVSSDEPFCIGQNTVFIVPRIEKRFFYYSMIAPNTKAQIEQYVTGSTQKTISLKSIKEIEFDLPPFSTQIRIADILSALDEKIELNRQTNATLEAIAQAIFKEWFVDFNFPGATGDMVEAVAVGAGSVGAGSEPAPTKMIPRGWQVGKVKELCDVNKNVITKNDNFEWIDYIEISEVTRGKIANISRYKYGEEPSRAKRKINHGDTVLSTVRPSRGSFFLSLAPPKTLIVSTGFAVFSPTKVPFSFLYLLLTDAEKLEYYGHVADGAAYPAIHPNLIMEMDVVIPKNSILNNFHSIAEPILNKIMHNEQEANNLAAIRYALLPKLMNGEINVDV
jgi:type I restriction enzyme, S subunit